MAPPVGLELGGSYTVGALLGQGAFGQVHHVVNNNSSKGAAVATKWACKLTKIPTKITKHAKTEAEIAYQRLWSENMIYSNHLRVLCGTILPKLPSLTKDGVNFYYDNVGGYRALVMEKMEGGLLMDALPQLVADCQTTKSNIIDLGPLAVRLMDMVRQMHDHSHLLVDVKPDNFMLTSSKGKNKNKKITPQSMAENARLIDLGLVKCFRGPQGHRPNDKGSAAVQGTPLYCSLNGHQGHTLSRRDDVEAMLFLMGDVVRTVTALAAHHHHHDDDGNNKKKKTKTKTNPPSSRLPWSREADDAAIGKAKEAAVLNRKSNYYKDMPKQAADVLFELLQEVRGYGYAKKPKYESLCARLAHLHVPAAAAASTVKPPKKSPQTPSVTAKETPRRSTRSRSSAHLDSDDRDDEEGVSPPPTSRRRMLVSSQTCRPAESPSANDVPMDDAAKDGKIPATDDDVVPMDIDSVNDDEVEEVVKVPASVPAAGSKTPPIFRGVKLVLSGGSSASTIYLVRGETESTELVDGNYVATLTLSDNPQGGVMVVGTGKDKTKDYPVKLGRQDIGESGAVAFSGQRLAIGTLRVDVQRLSETEYRTMAAANEETQPAAAASTTTKRRGTRSVMADAKDNVQTAAGTNKKKKKKTSASITVKIITLRQPVGTCVLEEGGLETVTIGSSPQGQGEKIVVPNLAASHVRLSLVHPKNNTGPMIQVTNLQSKKAAKSSILPTLLSHTDIAPGTWQMAFRGASVKLGQDTTLQLV